MFTIHQYYRNMANSDVLLSFAFLYSTLHCLSSQRTNILTSIHFDKFFFPICRLTPVAYYSWQVTSSTGSTGCQTCTLTATLKSQARWHGSQSTYSSVVTITSSHCRHLREAHPCASRTQVFLAHPPTVLFPFRAPHTQVLHTSMGSLTQGSN